MCSTPCGITGIGSAGDGIIADMLLGVLNALRHYKNRKGEMLLARLFALIECSTPCGITGIGSHRDIPRRSFEPGAQRLAALQE